MRYWKTVTRCVSGASARGSKKDVWLGLLCSCQTIKKRAQMRTRVKNPSALRIRSVHRPSSALSQSNSALERRRVKRDLLTGNEQVDVRESQYAKRQTTRLTCESDEHCDSDKPTALHAASRVKSYRGSTRIPSGTSNECERSQRRQTSTERRWRKAGAAPKQRQLQTQNDGLLTCCWKGKTKRNRC